MYTDATTARSENRNISIRNYSTDKYTGNLVHDHETVIYNYGNKHIECNVHVSRYLKGCYENTNHKWPLKMRSFLCSLNEYRKKLKTKNIEKLDSEKLERYSKRYDEILKEGYAELVSIKPNTKYTEYLEKFQNSAKDADKGFWKGEKFNG